MFDGNGNWTSEFSAQSDRDNGIKILASRFDNIFIADLKESFENCLTKDGQIAPIGDFSMGGQKITNLGAAVNSNDAINKAQLDAAISNIFSELYPVGSIYMGVQNTCPLATLIPNSEWTLVAVNKAIYGGDGSQAGTSLTAGLPNITGSASNVFMNNESTSDGALSKVPSSSVFNVTTSGGSAHTTGTISFSASISNSIYGASNTVQPPAYIVNVWQRTA